MRIITEPSQQSQYVADCLNKYVEPEYTAHPDLSQIHLYHTGHGLGTLESTPHTISLYLKNIFLLNNENYDYKIHHFYHAVNPFHSKPLKLDPKIKANIIKGLDEARFVFHRGKYINLFLGCSPDPDIKIWADKIALQTGLNVDFHTSELQIDVGQANSNVDPYIKFYDLSKDTFITTHGVNNFFQVKSASELWDDSEDLAFHLSQMRKLNQKLEYLNRTYKKSDDPFLKIIQSHI